MKKYLGVLVLLLSFNVYSYDTTLAERKMMIQKDLLNELKEVYVGFNKVLVEIRPGLSEVEYISIQVEYNKLIERVNKIKEEADIEGRYLLTISTNDGFASTDVDSVLEEKGYIPFESLKETMAVEIVSCVEEALNEMSEKIEYARSIADVIKLEGLDRISVKEATQMSNSPKFVEIRLKEKILKAYFSYMACKQNVYQENEVPHQAYWFTYKLMKRTESKFETVNKILSKMDHIKLAGSDSEFNEIFPPSISPLAKVVELEEEWQNKASGRHLNMISKIESCLNEVVNVASKVEEELKSIKRLPATAELEVQKSPINN